jgi:actin-related protein
MIDEARLAKALTYLATTDEELAELMDAMDRAEAKAEAIKDTVFLHEEGSVADRSAKARTAQVYQDAMDEYFKARREYTGKQNKRKTETIIVDVWRSLNAARRQGNV